MELFTFLISFLWLSCTFTSRHTSVTCCCLSRPIGKSQKRAPPKRTAQEREIATPAALPGWKVVKAGKNKKTIKGGEGSALSVFACRTVDEITLLTLATSAVTAISMGRGFAVYIKPCMWGDKWTHWCTGTGGHQGRHLPLFTYITVALVTIICDCLRVLPAVPRLELNRVILKGCVHCFFFFPNPLFDRDALIEDHFPLFSLPHVAKIFLVFYRDASS